MRRRTVGLSERGAAALKPRLEAFLATAPVEARLPFDPVALPRRYSDPADVEVVALLSASVAYGRADLFKPRLERLLESMGPSPAAFVRSLDVARARALLSGFVYRFNVGADLAVLLLGTGSVMRTHGGLEAVFVEQLENAGTLHGALSGFTHAIREAAPMPEIRRALGPVRGLDHLLPSPLGPGAAKRLNLFLRWMVRGPDGVDFGLWKRVPTSLLLIPLDTHIGRIARRLGLTTRKDLSWKTAEEITASLRRLDPVDPVRFDFALCHYGMSGVCPVRPVRQHCAQCLLRPVCRVGRRVAPAGPATRSGGAL